MDVVILVLLFISFVYVGGRVAGYGRVITKQEIFEAEDDLGKN